MDKSKIKLELEQRKIDDILIHTRRSAQWKSHGNAIYLSELISQFISESQQQEENKGEWISVEDRLPDFKIPEREGYERRRFLTVNIYGTILVRYYVKNKKGSEGFFSLSLTSNTPVTHWMELPPPP